MEIRFFKLEKSVYFTPQLCFSWAGSKRIFVGWLNFYWLIIFKTYEKPEETKTDLRERSNVL